jgi:uncharacterized protein YegL
MPIFNDNTMEQHNTGGATNFGFSAKRIEDLGATEYTLVGLTVDVSGSVQPFETEIVKCVKEVIRSCQHSPRADNLMIRTMKFSSRIDEVHGYRPLAECDIDKYDDQFESYGLTQCYDATVSQLDSMTKYSKDLVDNDFDVNGILFVITDGLDNQSTLTPAIVKERVNKMRKMEELESLVTILVGVNVTDPDVQQYLQMLETEGGFSQYLELKDAKATTLAKLAEFVSKSISAQSQALGTGGPSQPVSF